MGLALGMALKHYTSVTKRLKLKLRKSLGPILSFVEVTREKIVNDGRRGEGGWWRKSFCSLPILDKVKLTQRRTKDKISIDGVFRQCNMIICTDFNSLKT